ncbi:MAG TPA: hypothetical protein VGR69_04860 [Candidatus Rubrimentiphilum sp.]|nr:hypothetical protein [Candidatus Rubrimentiphilum sp.]
MLPLFALLAAVNLPVAPADGTYRYTAMLAGAQAGSCTITVKHSADTVQIGEAANAKYGGASYAGNATLTLDPSLAPVSYTALYSPPGRSVHAAVAFKSNDAFETSDNGNQTFALNSGTQHFVLLDGTLFAGFFILPAQLHAWNAPPVTAVAPMFGRSTTIAAASSLKPDRPKTLPATDVAISVSDPVEFTLWYDPATLIVDELDVPNQSASFIRVR